MLGLMVLSPVTSAILTSSLPISGILSNRQPGAAGKDRQNGDDESQAQQATARQVRRRTGNRSVQGADDHGFNVFAIEAASWSKARPVSPDLEPHPNLLTALRRVKGVPAPLIHACAISGATQFLAGRALGRRPSLSSRTRPLEIDGFASLRPHLAVRTEPGHRTASSERIPRHLPTHRCDKSEGDSIARWYRIRSAKLGHETASHSAAPHYHCDRNE